MTVTLAVIILTILLITLSRHIYTAFITLSLPFSFVTRDTKHNKKNINDIINLKKDKRYQQPQEREKQKKENFFKETLYLE